jgi:serine/threonine protein kinase
VTPAEGDIIANRFQLIRELGRGSMGSVWLADHLTLEVSCAVKFIAEETVGDPRRLAQFHIEARAIARIQSPHVVRVFDHDVCDAGPYIAMELLVGEDLCTRLHRVGRLDAHATYQIAAQVARGLSKVHAAGIVHHDLKPENIFLAQEADEEVVKLLDFGVAKLTASSLLESVAAQTGGLIGTPEYMSPEQARGISEVDRRSDLWSLAIIVYQCLTGRLPFEGATLAELLGRIMCGPTPVPSEVAPDLPPDFDWWWAQATLRDIEGRFQSARHLADALGEALRMAETGATESHPVRGALTSSPRFDSLPAARSPYEPEAPRPGASSARRTRPWKLLAAAGLVVALIALLPWIGRSDAPIARANLAAPRAATVGPPPFDYETPVRLVAEATRAGAEVIAPETTPTGAGGDPAANSAVAGERPLKPAFRPRSAMTPRRDPSPSDPPPRKLEADVDFGI